MEKSKIATMVKENVSRNGDKSLKIKIFADGANKEDMLNAYRKGLVDGFTTNPTLMKKAGVQDYGKFAREILSEIKDLYISFEVFSDDFPSMEKQAREIHGWAENIHVKIPVTNTKGHSSCPMIKKLSDDGIPLNITAIFTLDQVREVSKALNPKTPSIISIFAGRIADTGVNPMPAMSEAVKLVKHLPLAEVLWASSREVLNIFQAQECGCHIITVTPDILKKMSLLGSDLKAMSLDTVKTFYEDGLKAGFSI